jgi:hypothetical protein
MIERWRIHGHAIVSADDRIAAADGRTPPDLRNEADWNRFQAALDAAAVTVLGRLGHQANPNARRRNRMVVSSASHGLERRDDGWWWNPARTPIASALARAAPDGGIVAVVGGRLVFDLFLAIGFDAFHLARAGRVLIPDGIPLFSAIGGGRGADRILAGTGLVAGPPTVLDATAAVSVVAWRRGLDRSGDAMESAPPAAGR